MRITGNFRVLLSKVARETLGDNTAIWIIENHGESKSPNLPELIIVGAFDESVATEGIIRIKRRVFDIYTQEVQIEAWNIPLSSGQKRLIKGATYIS